MKQTRKSLMSTSLILPAMLGLGLTTATTAVVLPSLESPAAAACNPCAAKRNPCAAYNPCNPCAAKNPCAAQACNPCAAKNPCAAANPCAANPCNPCAAKKY